jgi:hypothetical protein
LDKQFWDAIVLTLWIAIPPFVILNVAGLIWIKLTANPKNPKPIKKTIVWRDDV